MIEVVRAQAAIINSVLFLCRSSLLNRIQTQRFSQVFDASLIIATRARTTPVTEIFSSRKKPSLETVNCKEIPQKERNFHAEIAESNHNHWRWKFTP